MSIEGITIDEVLLDENDNPILDENGDPLVVRYALLSRALFNGDDLLTTEHGRRAGLTTSGEFGGTGIPQLFVMQGYGISANAVEVTGCVVDFEGLPIQQPFMFDLWLSDSFAGEGLTATTPSGGVVIGDYGTIIATYTASKAWKIQADADGLFQIVITDTSKTPYVVCGCLDNVVKVGVALAEEDYG